MHCLHRNYHLGTQLQLPTIVTQKAGPQPSFAGDSNQIHTEMTMRLFPLTLLLALCSFAATLHNSDVLLMVKRGVSASEIIATINNSESGFQLLLEDVHSLEKHGVPATVIDTMLVRNANSRLMVGDPTSVPPAESTVEPSVP